MDKRIGRFTFRACKDSDTLDIWVDGREPYQHAIGFITKEQAEDLIHDLRQWLASKEAQAK